MLAIKKLILHVFYVNDILVTLLYLITTYHFREKCLYMYWYQYKLSYSINIYYYMQGRFLWMIVYQQVICSTSVWIIRFREEMRVFLWNRSAEKRCKLHYPVILEGHTASHCTCTYDDILHTAAGCGCVQVPLNVNLFGWVVLKCLWGEKYKWFFKAIRKR